MGPLLQWAVDSGVEFHAGVELMANPQSGDITVVTTIPMEPGTSVVSIPSYLILSSEHYQDSSLQKWIASSIYDQQYVPEFLLVIRFLEEVSLGESSAWHPWIQSLPNEFTTALYMDDFERGKLQRMAPQFVEKQDQQWEFCLFLFRELLQLGNGQGQQQTISTQNQMMVVSDISLHLQQWLAAHPNLESLLRWAFSVVFTRSWRSPDGKDATIVPLGDLFNHHSQNHNLRPNLQKPTGSTLMGGKAEDFGRLQLCLVDSTETATPEQPTEFFLSYGSTHEPARFLALFGFCDTSSLLVDAQMDQYLQKHGLPALGDDDAWPSIDPSECVVSSGSGILAEDVWRVGLIKVLTKSYPSQLENLRSACSDVGESEELDDDLWETLLLELEEPVAKDLLGHFEHLLETNYAPISVTDYDLRNHRHLSMIVDFHQFMRQTYTKALYHVKEILNESSRV